MAKARSRRWISVLAARTKLIAACCWYSVVAVPFAANADLPGEHPYLPPCALQRLRKVHRDVASNMSTRRYMQRSMRFRM